MKVTILQGIPGSGKTAWATKAVQEDLNTVIVSRDAIRDALGVHWVPARERLVSAIEKEMILAALKFKYSVIIDATNLNPRNLSRLKDIIFEAEYSNPEGETILIEYKRFDIALWKAIYRDWKRGLLGGRRTGVKVIKDFYERYIKNNRN